MRNGRGFRTYSVELIGSGYGVLVTEIKKKVELIEEWRLYEIQKSIDTLAECGLCK